jgi:hypothetical protein
MQFGESTPTPLPTMLMAGLVQLHNQLIMARRGRLIAVQAFQEQATP